jgi:ribosomal protein S18 acetylase RimI-like enzyme
MSDVTVRTANEEDSEQLEHLEREAWSSESSPNPLYEGPVFGKRIPFADVIVASSGGTLIGYIAIGRRTPFASNAHVGVVRSIVVAAGQKRAGIGKRLLAEAEREARRRGFKALRLTVMASNVAARGLYVSAGFSELGRYPAEFRVGDAWVDDVFMGKLLQEG